LRFFGLLEGLNAHAANARMTKTTTPRNSQFRENENCGAGVGVGVGTPAFGNAVGLEKSFPPPPPLRDAVGVGEAEGVNPCGVVDAQTSS